MMGQGQVSQESLEQEKTPQGLCTQEKDAGGELLRVGAQCGVLTLSGSSDGANSETQRHTGNRCRPEAGTRCRSSFLPGQGGKGEEKGGLGINE